MGVGSCPIVMFCSGGHDIKGSLSFFLKEEIKLIFGDDDNPSKSKVQTLAEHMKKSLRRSLVRSLPPTKKTLHLCRKTQDCI